MNCIHGSECIKKGAKGFMVGELSFNYSKEKYIVSGLWLTTKDSR